MRYDPERHRRRSIRLRGYNYTQAGSYFITICTQDRACLFGEVVSGDVRLNDAGRMIHAVWDELPNHYPGVITDAFVVMPNHIHGIITLVGADPRVCPDRTPAHPDVGADPRVCPDTTRVCPVPPQGQPQRVAPTLGLPDVVHRFKTITTKKYVDGVKQHNWQPFRGRLWQRNYYEHIIRDENALNKIREYIQTNPTRWASDRENPFRQGDDPYEAWLSQLIRRTQENARRQSDP